MGVLTLYLLALVLGFLIYYTLDRWRKIRRLPPGPWGLPIVGYLPWIDQNLYRLTARMGEKYGPVFCMKLGGYDVVFLHGIDAAREAFIKYADVFSGRAQLYWLVSVNEGRGIVPTEGEVWKTIRRYTTSSLRDFGMGKLSLEGKIHDEIQHVFRRIDASGGRPFRASPVLANAVCNVICSVLFGKRFDYDDLLFKQMIAAATEGFGVGQGAVLNWLPWLRFFPPFNRLTKLLLHVSEPMFENVRDSMRKAEANLDADMKPANFVEALLDEVRKGGTRAETLKKHVLNITNQLFIAANETTATALDWGVLLLVLKPEVQTKMQQEIDRVVGRDRLPSWQDRSHLVFVEATVNEILRMANIGAVSLPHRCTEDTEFRGYLIPKDCVVFASLGWWPMDPVHFPDPCNFQPERFITADGKVDHKKPTEPFGLGKRECAGEALAKMEMFDFLAALVQNYTLRPAPGQTLSYVEVSKRPGAWSTHPEPFDIIAVRR